MGLVKDLVAVGIPARQAPFLGVEFAGFFNLVGNSQATGYPIVTSAIWFTGGTAGTQFCARLPKAEQAPHDIFIRNDSGISMTLYPAIGQFLNWQSVDIPIVVATGRGIHCIRINDDRFMALVSAA